MYWAQLLLECFLQGEVRSVHRSYWGNASVEGLRTCHRGRGDEAGTRAKVQGWGFFPTDALYQLHVPKDANPSTDDPKASSTVIGGRGGLGPGLLVQTHPPRSEVK